jgi:hypothetical protein
VKKELQRGTKKHNHRGNINKWMKRNKIQPPKEASSTSYCKKFKKLILRKKKLPLHYFGSDLRLL